MVISLGLNVGLMWVYQVLTSSDLRIVREGKCCNLWDGIFTG